MLLRFGVFLCFCPFSSVLAPTLIPAFVSWSVSFFSLRSLLHRPTPAGCAEPPPPCRTRGYRFSSYTFVVVVVVVVVIFGVLFVLLSAGPGSKLQLPRHAPSPSLAVVYMLSILFFLYALYTIFMIVIPRVFVVYFFSQYRDFFFSN